ncbi:MAG: cysteine desulfurase [Myxococcales bacterium]|nr:cysteine desulfurase [Myxococcales bacterium]
MKPNAIYLDHCATTPLDPAVFEEMKPFFLGVFGNPSSAHRMGRAAKAAVSKAREQVASLVGAEPSSVVFTSGATEALNLALRGFCSARKAGTHVVASAIEHKAVLSTLEFVAARAHGITLVKPEPDGVVATWAFEAALGRDVGLATLMWVNNETGVMQPVPDVARLCAQRDIPFVTDATQAVGKIPIDLGQVPIDGLALSGHKLNGPMGVGALVVSPRFRSQLEPLICGGGQEGGLRGGTLNLPGIVGLGAACALASRSLDDDARLCASLIGSLEAQVREVVTGVSVVGAGSLRAPHCSLMKIDGVDGEALVANLPDVMVSTGSACNSHAPTPSHVLMAMGFTEDDAYSTVRISVGRRTTQDEIDRAVVALSAAISRLRALN